MYASKHLGICLFKGSELGVAEPLERKQEALVTSLDLPGWKLHLYDMQKPAMQSHH